jgi:hypothetical protein
MTQNRSLISTRRCAVAASASVSNSSERDIGEADRRLAVHAERATCIPMAFRDHPPAPELHAHRSGDRAHGHVGTGDQRFQQHVSGAGQAPVAAGGRMQAGAFLVPKT